MNPLSHPWSRRRLLQHSLLATGAWLTPLAHRLAIASETKGSRPKSLIILWMQGGISQLESFDPHPGSATAFGSRDIETAVKGIRFGEGLPLTAEMAADFSVLRSVTSKEGDHTRAIYNAKTGYRPFAGLEHPAIGSILCHELDAIGSDADGSDADGPGTDATLDLPAHISILPGGNPSRGGYLGAKHDAFQVDDPVKPMPDVRAHGDEQRQRGRLDSLGVLERSFANGRLAELESERTLHLDSIRRARQLMSSEQIAAFDVRTAPRSEREGFGDTPFGRGCLAAVRLVEVGVRCVEVTLGGWDTHINNHEGHKKQLAVLDPAFSATIRLLKERGLYEDTLVLVATEFGRTPKLNVAEGRDHWPHGFSVAIGGGGLRGGLAVGETDPEGKKRTPAREVRIEDIHATLLHRFGLDPMEELMTPIGRPLALSDGRLIRELL